MQEIALFGGIAPTAFGLYVLAEMALSLSPGPAVLFVASRGFAHGLRGGWPAALGVIVANGVYFALSALGIGAALLAMPMLFVAIKWVGAIYLLWLAYGAFIARPGALSLDFNAKQQSAWRTLRDVMLLQWSNPKALLFFVAILPQFVTADHPVAPQMIWLALGSMIPEFFILIGYAALAAKARMLLANATDLRWVERICAVLLALCAGMVLAS